MTVALAIPSEKENPASNPTTSTKTNWAYLRTRYGLLEILQIILGLLALALTQPFRQQSTAIVYVFMFPAFNIPLLTAVLLWDNASGRRLQQTLFGDFNHVGTYFNALAAGLYYLVSFEMLAYFVGAYHAGTNILAAAAGMGACVAHGWWLVYRAWVELGKEVGEKVSKV